MGRFKDYMSAMDAIEAGEKKLKTLQDELNSGKLHTYDELEGYSRTAERIAASYGKIKNIYERLGAQFDDGGAVSYYNGIRDNINGQLEQRKSNFNTIFNTNAKGIISGDRKLVASVAEASNRKLAVDTINKAVKGDYVSPLDIDRVTAYGESLKGSAALNDGGASMQLANAIEKLGETKGYYSLFRDEGDYIRRGKYAGKTYNELNAYLKELKADKSKNKAEITFLEAYITEKKKTKHIDDAKISMYRDPDFQQKVIEAVRSGISGSFETQLFDKNGNIKPIDIDTTDTFDKSIFNMTYEQAIEKIEKDPELAKKLLLSSGVSGEFLGVSSSNGIKRISPYGVQVQADLNTNYLTAEEVVLIAYTAQTKGAKEANLLMDELERTLGQRYAESEMLKMKEKYANTDFWGAVGLNATTVLASPITAMESLVDDVGDLITKGAIDPYNSASNIIQMQGEHIRTLTAEDIEKSTGSEALRMLYNGAMSAADMLVWSPLLGPAAYSLTMGAKSFVSEARQLYNEGAEDWQVATLATVKASLEIATEEIGADRFLDMLMNSGESAGKKLISNILSEIAEEEASLLAGDAFDRVIRGEYSTYETKVRGYILDGMTEQQARDKASKDFLNEAAETAITTFFSVVLSSGSVAAVKGTGNLLDKRANTKAITLQGYNILNNENVDELIETALSLDENTRAYKLAQKFNSDTSLKNNGKRVGYLYDAVIKQIEGQITQNAYTATQKRLEKLGVDIHTAHNASRAIVDMAKFKNVDAKAKQAVLSNTAQKQVYFELTDALNGDQTADWVNAYYESIQDLKVQRNLTAATAQFTNEQYSQAKQQLNGENNGGIIDSTQNTGVENDGSTNAELLERGEVSAVSGSRNGIRQQSENSRKMDTFLRNGEKTQGVHRQRTAGSSGWLHTGSEGKSRLKISRGAGLLRSLRGKKLKATDSEGRILSEEIQNRFKNTVFKGEDGTILSLYHFTDVEFTVFDDGDIGFHFGTLDSAHKRKMDPYRQKNGDKEIYKEIYANIQNPIEIDNDRGVWDVFAVSDLLIDLGILNQQEVNELSKLGGFFRSRYKSEASVRFRELLKEKGYDGIIYTNGVEGDISVIVFDANQILTVAENGVLKEGCGVTENPSDTNTNTNTDTDPDPDLQSSANDGESIFTDPDVKEIARETTSQEKIDAMTGNGRTIRQRHVEDIAKKLDSGIKIVWDDGTVLGDKKGKWNGVTKTLTLNKNATLPSLYIEVFKHEFTHRLESKGTYGSFKNYLIKKSSVFEEYVRSQLRLVNGETFEGSREEAIEALTKHYRDRFLNDSSISKVLKNRFTAEMAEREIVADFVGQVLFKGAKNRLDIAQALSEKDILTVSSIETSMDALEELAATDRNLFQKLWDIVKGILRALSGHKQTQRLVTDLEYIEKRFARVYDSIDIKKPASKNQISQQYYISGSKGAENLYNTPDYLKPNTEQEWSEFNRSFANQTSGLKKGKTKNIIITTGNSIYSVFADGYMSGMIEDKQSIDDYIERKKRYEYYNRTGQSNKNNGSDELQRRNNSGYSDIFENSKTDSTDVELVERKSAKQSRSIKRDGTDNKGDQFSLGSPLDDARTAFIKYENGEITREQYMEQVERLWGEANEKYGTIKQGENSATPFPVSVPKAVAENKPTRQFVRTIIETGKLTDDMLQNMEASVLLGDFSYDVISDEKATKTAVSAVENGTAEDIWQQAVVACKVDKNTLAIGEQLLANAIKAENTADVLRLSAELADLFTIAGQSVQAARLIKKMTGAGKLVSLQRTVNTLNRDLQKKYGEKAPIIKISEKTATMLMNAKTKDGIEHAYNEVLQEVAAKTPVTFMDKWNAWRYFAMLSNPKTHIRNLVGNAIFLPAVRIKDFLATGMERLIKEENRTKTLYVKKEYADFAAKDCKSKETQALLKGNKYNDKSALKEKQRIFETKALDFLTTFNSNALEAEDALFKNRHYRHALGGYLQARKINLKNITEEQLMNARIYAVNEAKKATFNDASAVADAIQKFSNKNIGRQILVEGILPFKRTPVNIVKRGIEYSPIGLFKTFSKGVYDVKKGKITATEFIDGLASGLTGTGIMAVGMLLANLGLISASGRDDEESEYEKWLGKQEYAIEFLGVSYTIDWSAPSAIPFFVGAEVVNAINSGEDFSFAKIGNYIWNSLEPITNLSMLSGLQGTIESVRYADSSQTLAAIVMDAGLSYAMQPIPSILGATARTVDPVQRTWYTDENSKWFDEFSQNTINNVKSKIPGLSYTQPAKIDPWGREVSRGNVGERIAENFISPGYYSEISYTETDTELKRLFKTTGENVFPQAAGRSFEVSGKTKYLTADEYVKYAKAKGQYSYEYINEFLESKPYKKLDDNQKAEVITKLYSFANARAKAQVSKYDPSEISTYKTVSKYEKNGGSAVDYYIGRVLDK